MVGDGIVAHVAAVAVDGVDLLLAELMLQLVVAEAHAGFLAGCKREEC